MTKTADLKRAEKAAERDAAAAASAARARRTLETAIRRAAASGSSVREIAAATGLGKSRIHQIASREAS